MNAGAKRKIAIGAIVATAAGGGVAWAATSSGGNLRTQYLNDVAKRLDVSPDTLNSALKGAYLDQLDQAVTDGRLTQAQADALKKRAQNGNVPYGLGRGMRGAGQDKGRGHGFGRGGEPFGSTIGAAATFLGLSELDLQTQLRSGTSLADIAKQKGKATGDLVAAIVAAEEKQLDQAVDAKRITSDQRATIEKNLPAHVQALVEGGPPAGAGGARIAPWGSHAPSGDYRPAPAPGAGADL